MYKYYIVLQYKYKKKKTGVYNLYNIMFCVLMYYIVVVVVL